MPKPFDATLKDLLQARPGDWSRYLDLSRARRAKVIEADVSTVTAQADKVLVFGGPRPSLVYLEFQASYDDELAERVLVYNVLLQRRHRMPVQSVVVLLRRSADGPRMGEGLSDMRWPTAAATLSSSIRSCEPGRKNSIRFWMADWARCHWRLYAMNLR